MPTDLIKGAPPLFQIKTRFRVTYSVPAVPAALVNFAQRPRPVSTAFDRPWSGLHPQQPPLRGVHNGHAPTLCRRHKETLHRAIGPVSSAPTKTRHKRRAAPLAGRLTAFAPEAIRLRVTLGGGTSSRDNFTTAGGRAGSASPWRHSAR